MRTGGWALAIGDGASGVGPTPQPPTPQSPIPNPQSPLNENNKWSE